MLLLLLQRAARHGRCAGGVHRAPAPTAGPCPPSPQASPRACSTPRAATWCTRQPPCATCLGCSRATCTGRAGGGCGRVGDTGWGSSRQAGPGHRVGAASGASVLPRALDGFAAMPLLPHLRALTPPHLCPPSPTPPRLPGLPSSPPHPPNQVHCRLRVDHGPHLPGVRTAPQRGHAGTAAHVAPCQRCDEAQEPGAGGRKLRARELLLVFGSGPGCGRGG